MTEFKSQLEELLPCRELLFNGTPGFGRYASLLSHSVAHPAKMNTRLTEFLVTELTKAGDLVLDPMSGTGQTGLIAALNGRDAVCVELEKKFYDWQLEAKKNFDTIQTFTEKGSLSCMLGDARKLSNLLGYVDAVVTSPPYSRDVVPHTSLRPGDVDAIITSPPYGEAQEGKGIAVNGRGDKHSPTDLVGERSYMPNKFESEGNISNLKFGSIDAVITSPPYEETKHFHDMDFMKKITQDQNSKIQAGVNSGHSKSVEAANRSFEVMSQGELENKENIGNLKKETYLEAMLRVYMEMFKVLKPGGAAAIVVKPFVRNKKVVDLPFQTWLLMKKCGFQLTKLFKLLLDSQSFWRILYMKKYPEVPEIWHEYVLVCEKPRLNC